MSAAATSDPVTSADANNSPLTWKTSADKAAALRPFADQVLWARVARHALCADGELDPDEWFPVSAKASTARREAAAAIAVCMACLVRSQCLALSLRHWDIGRHGVWGGLVAADRARLRSRLADSPEEARELDATQGDGVAV